MPGKTLDEMEGVAWGEPDYPSGLVIRCHALRKKPLEEFSLDDIRVMIGQSISLPILVPLALQVLEVDPLVETRGTSGGLLSGVLNADRGSLANSLQLLERIRVVTERAARILQSGETDLDSQEQLQLMGRIEAYLAAKA